MWLYLPLWEPDPLGGHLGTGVHRKRTCDRKSGVAALIAAAVISGKWLIHTELSLLTLTTVAFTSLMAVTCAAVMMVPSLVRILREP